MSISEQTSALKVHQRQYVNFVFYKVDPAWRRLPENVRTQDKQEFLRAITKRSVYVDHHTHSGQEGKRLTVVPGKSKYIFVYPFLKTREWFLLTKAARQGMMDEHIEVGVIVWFGRPGMGGGIRKRYAGRFSGTRDGAARIRGLTLYAA